MTRSARLSSLHRTALCAFPVLSALAGCGGGSEPLPPENHAPVWTDMPAEPAAIGQGQSIVLPLTLEDEDGDPLTVTVDPAKLPAGLEVEVAEGSDSLRIHTDYTAVGAVTFEVSVDDGSGAIAFPVGLDVRPIRWLGEQSWTSDGPEAREHATMIVDAAKQRAFMIGGSGYAPQGTPLGDVWRHDLTNGAWTADTATGDVLPPAGSRRAAAVPGQTVAYLFGGYGTNFASNSDVYRVRFDGDTLDFKLLQATNPPPARALHMFVHDALHDRFIAFGGVSNKVHGDTWVMKVEGDTAVWEQLMASPAPTPRYGFFYGVDETNGRVVLFSGAQGTASLNPAQDTWVLDMRGDVPVWQLALDGADGQSPPGRRNGCAVFDPSGPRLVVFGGTANAMTTEPGLFVFDAREGKPRWAQLDLEGGPPLRSSGFGFRDEAADRTVLGFGNDSSIYRDWWSLGY
jgi:hypothetical protein